MIPELDHDVNPLTVDLPESRHVSAVCPEPRQVSATHPESHHITSVHSESCHFLYVAPRLSGTVSQYPRLASSMEDPPLMAAPTAGISKPTHSTPPVPGPIPLSVDLPIMAITLWSVWAAYTTTETLETATPTIMFPEVAAYAAEPPKVVEFAAVSPEAMAPAEAFPEMAAYPAEPPKAAALASTPCTVVASINELFACPARDMEAVYELSAHSVITRETTN